MKKVVIIDGQGGRMGRALVEEIHKLCPGQPLLALGANTTATAAMMKAGAAMGATGENPVLVACRDMVLENIKTFFTKIITKTSSFRK